MSVCPPPRPAGMAVISLAFGQYILEPLFMPCVVPPFAVKLATIIGLSKDPDLFILRMNLTLCEEEVISLTHSNQQLSFFSNCNIHALKIIIHFKNDPIITVVDIVSTGAK